MLKFKLTLLLSSFFISSILQADTEEARELISQAKCMECHNKSDFRHSPDKVNNFKKLHKSVKACVYSTKTGWFDDEVMDVTRHLNKEHYHYKSPPLEED